MAALAPGADAGQGQGTPVGSVLLSGVLPRVWSGARWSTVPRSMSHEHHTPHFLP